MKTFKEYQGLIESAQEILGETKGKWMAKGPAAGPAGGSRRNNPAGKAVQQDAENRKWEVASWTMEGIESDLNMAIYNLNASQSYPNEVRSAKKAYEKLKKLYDEGKKRYAAKDYEWIIDNGWKSRYVEYSWGVYDLEGQWEGPGWKAGRVDALEEIGKLRMKGKNVQEEVEQVDEKFKIYKDEAPSAEDLAYVKKDFANMVKIFKKKIAKMERLVVKLKEKLASAKTPKGKANLEDRLYTETDAVKWHKEWLRDAEAKGKKGIEKGDYDTIESAVDDLGAWAFDGD